MDEFFTGTDLEAICDLIEDLHSGALLHIMAEDFKNLVTWSHSHSTICPHIPYRAEGYRLEEVNTFVLPWNCTAGHAYNWPLSSLSGKVGEAKKILSRTKTRNRFPPGPEEEEQDIAEGPADLSIARGEAPAESDDSQSSLVTHASGERGDDVSREQREAPTPERTKGKTQKRKKKGPSTCTWRPQEQATTSTDSPIAGKSSAPWGASLPKISKLSESAIQEMACTAEDNATTAAAFDNSQLSMHLEDLGSDTDSAAEDELMNTSQTGAGDAASTTPLRGRRKSETEGHPSPATPGSPHADPSTSTAPGSSADRSNRRMAAARKKPKGILGSLCNVLSFQAWLASMRPNHSRSLGCLSLIELDALLVSYLIYMWEGGSRQLTQTTLMCHARCLDRHLRVQGCFYSVLRSPELPDTRQLLDEYCQVLREREMDRHAEVIRSVTTEEEEELRRLGVLGRGSPEALLHLVLFNNLRAFGPKHLYRMWPVPAGKFHLMRVAPTPRSGVNRPVLDCLEWVDPADSEQPPLRMFAQPDDPLRCPLQDFRVYATKHTAGFLSHHDAIYSNQRTGVDLQSHEWYNRSPMSKSRMDKLMRALAQRIDVIRVTHTITPV